MSTFLCCGKRISRRKVRLRIRRGRGCFKQSVSLRRGGSRVQVDELALNRKSDSSLFGTREKESTVGLVAA